MIDKLGLKIAALELLTGNSEWCYSPEGDNIDNSDFYIQHVCYPNDYNGLRPTQDEVENKANEMWSDYLSVKYQRDRQYPPIEEQLDMLYWDMKNGTSTWATTVDKIKNDFPK
mgnify:CR=1 FL=1